MKYWLEEGAFELERAHETDAGLDIRSREYRIIPKGQSCVFHTGVHIQLPTGCAGMIMSKSGLNIKHDITSTGLIDEGYEGELVIKLYNHGESDYTVEAGDKISQLVVVPVLYVAAEKVDHLEAVSDRGSNGFGSTGV